MSWPQRKELQIPVCEHECDLGRERLKDIIAHVDETGHQVVRVYEVHQFIDPESVAAYRRRQRRA